VATVTFSVSKLEGDIHLIVTKRYCIIREINVFGATREDIPSRTQLP